MRTAKPQLKADLPQTTAKKINKIKILNLNYQVSFARHHQKPGSFQKRLSHVRSLQILATPQERLNKTTRTNIYADIHTQ